MSSHKDDYSELVTALQNHQTGDANALLKQLVPALRNYLKVVMDADPRDAEDVVQQALLNICEKIMRDEIRDKKYIYKYLLTTCRNLYLNLVQKKDQFSIEDTYFSSHMVSPQQQIANILDKERQNILSHCLQKLRKKSRIFITYIINHPKANTKALSEHFGLSESNVRVKKSRIISDLSHCVKKRMEQ